MSDTTPNSPEGNSPNLPTIEEERHFLAQCEYINQQMRAVGARARKLLRERGWRTQWCAEDEEEVWIKTFPDGTTQHLNEDDAYYCEQDEARQFFRNAGIAMKPRARKPPTP